MNLSEMKLTYKAVNKTVNTIGKSTDIYNVLSDRIFDVDTIELQESFYAIYLNRNNQILGFICISQGGTTSTVVDIKRVVAPAILSNSSSVIIAHNHPSGNKKPSTQDKELTKKVKKALNLFDISLIDHIIVTSCNYYSFADENII
jgi:DNA repair protein RadC